MIVTGDVTTYSTQNSVTQDQLIELGTGTTGTPSNDSGIIIERGSSSNAFIGFDESEDKFTMGTTTATGSSTGNLSITTGTLVANLEGNVTGNAATITATANSADETTYITFVDGPTGSQAIETHTGLTYNPSAGTLTCTTGLFSGNVGIGTTSPSEKLEVVGDISGEILSCKSIQSSKDAAHSEPLNITKYAQSSNNNRGSILSCAFDSSAVILNIATIRGSGFNTYPGGCINFFRNTGSAAALPKIEICGAKLFNCQASDGSAVSSDERIKHNELDISNGLITVNKLNPQFYIKTYDVTDICGNEYPRNHNFTTNDLSNGLPLGTYYESGYIAQDVSNIAELNHLIAGDEYDESGNPTELALNYTGIQPYLTKAIQELHVLVLQQQQQILDLSAQVAALS